MAKSNPISQFVVGLYAHVTDGPNKGHYVLQSGIWLVCTNPEIIRGIDEGLVKVQSGGVLFRDYWSVACENNGCPLAVSLMALVQK